MTKKLTAAGRRLLAHIAEHGNADGYTGGGGLSAIKKLRDDGYLTKASTSYRAELTDTGRAALR